MYPLIAATHALTNETTDANDMYLAECQDSSLLNKDLTKGKLLVCSYSIRFVLGLSSIKQALQSAKNVSAVGVIFYMDPFVIGFQLNPTPMHMPGLIIPSPDDSKVCPLRTILILYVLLYCRNLVGCKVLTRIFLGSGLHGSFATIEKEISLVKLKLFKFLVIIST